MVFWKVNASHDLKVNETNAEYLVRKFGELESKPETALQGV